MANRYSQPPPGKIWVPTPNGPVAMTLAEARLYQAAHRYAATDPQNPNLSPEVRAELQDPRIQAAIQSGQSTTVRVGDTDYRLEHGRVVSMEQGGHSALSPLVWAAKHPKTTIALMAAPVAAPYAVQTLTGGGGAAGAGEAGAGTGVTSGAASAVPAGVLPATATIPTSTGTVAGLSGGTGFGTAAGTGAATGAGAGAGAGAAESVLPATQTVPGSTGTSLLTGVPPSGRVAAAMAPRTVGSVLSGIGSWLGTPGGSEALKAGTGLLGAGIAAGGITKAAEIEAQTAREALAYAKQRDQYLQNLEAQRYGQFNARMQPYMNLGQSAGARMAQILGLDPSQFAPTQTWPGVSGSETGVMQPDIRQRGPTTPGGPAEGTVVPQSDALVTMKAPDGSIQQVPQAHVSHYSQLGATVLG